MHITAFKEATYVLLSKVRFFRCVRANRFKEWLILNEADMTVDSKGNSVTVEARLADISARFGVQSDEFKKAQELCKRLKLISAE